MFNKFKENRYIKNNIKKDVHLLCTEIESIRKVSNILTICPLPTGNNWQGINVATKQLFDNSVFEIPQYFSRNIYSEDEFKLLVKNINLFDFKLVVFSGFPDYFSSLVKNIKTIKAVIFHGSLSEFNENNNQLAKIFDLYKLNHIQKIAFIKKDLKEYFENLLGIKSYHLINKTNISENIQKYTVSRGNNIGVFGNDTFNKNLITQIAGGLLIPDSKVHIISECETSFLNNPDRIIKHEKSERNFFLGLMGSMNINSHLSFSESWGQLVTESLALGVPCLTSDNNGIFDYDDYLAGKLIVSQYDNPLAIADQIKKVLENRDEISKRGVDYIKKLNKISDEKLKEFLQ